MSIDDVQLAQMSRIEQSRRRRRQQMFDVQIICEFLNKLKYLQRVESMRRISQTSKSLVDGTYRFHIKVLITEWRRRRIFFSVLQQMWVVFCNTKMRWFLVDEMVSVEGESRTCPVVDTVNPKNKIVNVFVSL